ncbi:TIR domain-containing protein [Cladochytrium replicatum]|nr:TIR domain-containing protein [Cladochytrium replicatum]
MDEERFDVFLSYQWDHQDIVMRIKSALIQRGFKAWMDVDHLRGDLDIGMAKGVRGACLVLPFLTARYDQSQSCRNELGYAVDLKKQILPIRVEEGPFPNFGDITTARMRYISVTKEEVDDIERWNSKLSQIIGEILERLPADAPYRTRGSSDESNPVQPTSFHLSSVKSFPATTSDSTSASASIENHSLLTSFTSVSVSVFEYGKPIDRNVRFLINLLPHKTIATTIQMMGVDYITNKAAFVEYNETVFKDTWRDSNASPLHLMVAQLSRLRYRNVARYGTVNRWKDVKELASTKWSESGPVRVFVRCTLASQDLHDWPFAYDTYGVPYIWRGISKPTYSTIPDSAVSGPSKIFNMKQYVGAALPTENAVYTPSRLFADGSSVDSIGFMIPWYGKEHISFEGMILLKNDPNMKEEWVEIKTLRYLLGDKSLREVLDEHDAVRGPFDNGGYVGSMVVDYAESIGKIVPEKDAGYTGMNKAEWKISPHYKFLRIR